MTIPLRLAPSGPVLATLGAGARLRLVEATATSIVNNTIPTTPGVIGNPIGSATLPPLALLAPSPGNQYRATVCCDVHNASTNLAGSVELYFDVSKDGIVWNEVASNSHDVSPGNTRSIRLDMPLQPGTGLGVVAGDAVVELRCRIGAFVLGGGSLTLVGPTTPGGDTHSVGAIDIQFEEALA